MFCNNAEKFLKQGVGMSEKEVNGVLVDCEGIDEETHPFNNPSDLKGAKYLFVGTFPPRRFYTKELEKGDIDWFYGSKKNEFWGVGGKKGLIQQALSCDDELDTFEKRKEFCQKRHIAFLDLFQKIYRYGESASDSNIFPIAKVNLIHYLKENSEIEAVFFTSGWVMDIAKKEYKRLNRTYVEELHKNGYVIKSAKNTPKLEVDCVIGNVFVLEDSERNQTREVGIYALKSPSSSAKTSSNAKVEQWRKILSKIIK